MKLPRLLLFCLPLLVLAACGAQPTPLPATATSTSRPPSPTSTTAPTATLAPPAATPTTLPVPPTPVKFPFRAPPANSLTMDFVAQACAARWANGANLLPCPGNLDALTEGYISPAENAVAEGGIIFDAPTLIGLPGLGGEHGAGLFGTYPPLLVKDGDTFKAVLACQDGSYCDVEFALNYLDAKGKYHHEMGWSWKHAYGGGPTPVKVDLSPLAGKTVQLVLALNDLGTPQDDWVLWGNPYVERSAP
jgi:hypothetical protein